MKGGGERERLETGGQVRRRRDQSELLVYIIGGREQRSAADQAVITFSDITAEGALSVHGPTLNHGLIAPSLHRIYAGDKLIRWRVIEMAVVFSYCNLQDSISTRVTVCHDLNNVQ